MIPREAHPESMTLCARSFAPVARSLQPWTLGIKPSDLNLKPEPRVLRHESYGLSLKLQVASPKLQASRGYQVYSRSNPQTSGLELHARPSHKHHALYYAKHTPWQEKTNRPELKVRSRKSPIAKSAIAAKCGIAKVGPQNAIAEMRTRKV